MDTMPAGRRGFGVAGALAHDIVRELARAAEGAGYRTFWVNDTPGGDGLAALREAAAVTGTIRLGIGVIPLDRQSAGRIVERIAELGLPVGRLTLGVGSGQRGGGLDRVRAGALALRKSTEATIIVGALGPRMSGVAGETADGVLFNWLTPAAVPAAAELVRGGARGAGRPMPRIDGYVRTALGSAAIARLHEEADRYASYPAYAANFARMGVTAMETAVFGEVADIQAALTAFDAVLDETVVRAIAADETERSYRDLLETAAPR